MQLSNILVGKKRLLVIAKVEDSNFTGHGFLYKFYFVLKAIHQSQSIYTLPITPRFGLEN